MPVAEVLTVAEFEARLSEFPSDRFEFYWDLDWQQVTVVPLKWWDDASYRAYQTDCGADYGPEEE